MEKILIATHNPSKAKLYQNDFKNLEYEFVTLDDLNIDYDVEELPNATSIENSQKKALEYSKISGMITIADDCSLIFENIPEKYQPGTHVRRIHGEEAATDEELLEYYKNLFNKFGGKVKGYWDKYFSIASDKYVKTINYKVPKLFVSEQCKKYHKGFPLDSLSITEKYNKYTVELSQEEITNIHINEVNKLSGFLKDELRNINNKN